MATSSSAPVGVSSSRWRSFLAIAGVLVLVCAMAVDTTVVLIGGEEDLREQAFDPDAYGNDEFPRIRDFVIDKAPEASVLAQELAADKAAAVASYGTSAGVFPVMPVTFTGIAGESSSGILNISIEGMPEGTGLRLQTGPAINGTDLRDVVGDISFGSFKNQIEYQDAGAGINRAMASQILNNLDRETLTGKSITATGAFTMINAKNWLITPVALEVQ